MNRTGAAYLAEASVSSACGSALLSRRFRGAVAASVICKITRKSGGAFLLVLALMAGMLPPMSAAADEIRPALLDIKEQNTGLFSVT